MKTLHSRTFILYLLQQLRKLWLFKNGPIFLAYKPTISSGTDGVIDSGAVLKDSHFIATEAQNITLSSS